MALTERQSELMELLLSGVPRRQALNQCGYSQHTSMSNILKSEEFRKEYIANVEGMIVLNGVKAVETLEDALINNNEPGIQNRIKAATELLDRSGLGKIERKQESEATINNLFILPPKADD